MGTTSPITRPIFRTTSGHCRGERGTMKGFSRSVLPRLFHDLLSFVSSDSATPSGILISFLSLVDRAKVLISSRRDCHCLQRACFQNKLQPLSCESASATVYWHHMWPYWVLQSSLVLAAPYLSTFSYTGLYDNPSSPSWDDHHHVDRRPRLNLVSGATSEQPDLRLWNSYRASITKTKHGEGRCDGSAKDQWHASFEGRRERLAGRRGQVDVVYPRPQPNAIHQPNGWAIVLSTRGCVVNLLIWISETLLMFSRNPRSAMASMAGRGTYKGQWEQRVLYSFVCPLSSMASNISLFIWGK